MYTYTHISRLCYAQLYPHPWAPAHARAHTSAHTRERASGAPPRTTARAASNTRRARPSSGGAPPGAGKAAHTCCNVVTDAVFHAPMFALNADAESNACAPEPPAVHRRREGARMCRRGCKRARSHTHTRARTDTARGRVCAAGWHRRSVRRCSQTRYMHASCIYIL